MKRVYENLDYSMVGHFKSLLESSGIKCEIRNESGIGLAGEVPVNAVYPELWVLSNRDEKPAKQIIDDYLKKVEATPVGPAWTCTKCGESVEGQFAECWNCGQAAPEKT